MEKRDEALTLMVKAANKLKKEYEQPQKRMYVPKYGINNTYGWKEFIDIANLVSEKPIDDKLDGSSLESAYSVKVALFQQSLVSRGDHSDIFHDLCLNDYWLWSLVEESATAAIRREVFPITVDCFVEAIETLKRAIPQVRFDALEATLIRQLSERTGTTDLVERSLYLKRRAENQPVPPLAAFIRQSITEEGFQEYLKHGLILIDDEYESDPKKADIRFNKLLLLDWQLGQRGPVFVHREGLEIKQYFS